MQRLLLHVSQMTGRTKRRELTNPPPQPPRLLPWCCVRVHARLPDCQSMWPCSFCETVTGADMASSLVALCYLEIKSSWSCVNQLFFS